MSLKTNKVLYWCSVIGPLVDCVIGVIKGCVKGYYDAKLQAMEEWNIEQQKKFRSTFEDTKN